MAKKSFNIQIENQTLRNIEAQENAVVKHFLTPEQTDNTDNKQQTEDAQQTGNTKQTEERPERKSKRLNLLIRPSLVADLYKVATMKETSINDLICMIIDEYNQKEAASIKKYNEVFKK